MAKVQVQCPTADCGQHYTVSESQLGKRAKCKKCHNPFVLATPKNADDVPIDWEPGHVILDKYEVQPLTEQRAYAEEGFGRVNRVWDREQKRPLAVKSLKPTKSGSANAMANFKKEAEVWVTRIGLHPNNVGCHFVFELGERLRIFMDFVDAGSLRDWIVDGRLYQGDTQEVLARILDFAIQFAWGLHYVHELGIVHKDVKPANAMLTSDGILRVTDFGLAEAREASGEESGESGPGQTVIVPGVGGCTPAFASPEQLGKRELTRRTDLWSWGVSVLQMFIPTLTEGNFLGPSAPIVLEEYLADEEAAADAPKLPKPVGELLRRCFQQTPEDRPRTMLDVAEQLQAAYRSVIGTEYPREIPEPSEDLAGSLNNRAVSLYNLDKERFEQEAHRLWEDALKFDPHHLESVYNKGLLDWRSAKVTDEQLLRSVREAGTSATTARAKYLVGLVHLERNDVKQAAEVLTEARQLDPVRKDIESSLEVAQITFRRLTLHTAALEGHTAVVYSVAISPDGLSALSASKDNSLRLWDIATGQSLYTFEGHTSPVRSVAFSPDGRLALSAGDDKTVRLWDVVICRFLCTFEGHTSPVRSAAFSPDGRLALSASEDKTVRLWDVEARQPLRTFKGHKGAILSAAFSPDGHFALTANRDCRIRLWDMVSGHRIRTFVGNSGTVRSVAFSPDSLLALSASTDKSVHLWKVATGNCIRTFEGHTSRVNSVAFSPDGRLAFSASWDKSVRMWEVETGRCLHTFEGHTSGVNSVAVHPDGRLALSASNDNNVRLWALTNNTYVAQLVTSPPTHSVRSDFLQLLTKAQEAYRQGHFVGAVSFLDQARRQPGCYRREEPIDLARTLSTHLAHRTFAGGWEQETWMGHANPVRSVSFHPDGRLALSASADKSLRLWEVATSRCLHTFKGHTDEVNSVEFSPDGRLALSASADKSLRLWEVATSRCLHTFKGHTGPILSVAFSPDGRFALSASKDKSFRLWKVATGKRLHTFKGHTGPILSVAFSPDGRFALSASKDKNIRLRGVATGNHLHIFKGHTGAILSIAFSPDGCFALSASRDKSLRLWEVATSRCLRTFEGHADSVNSVAFSPDGRFALSASSDKDVRLWEVATGQPLRVFEGHEDEVRSVAFSPDGRFALSASDDTSIRLWELDWEFERNVPADWAEGARPHLTNFLTLRSSTQEGQPTWHDAEFQQLLTKLGYAGFGWLRSEGVRRELEKMAASWQGPPPLE